MDLWVNDGKIICPECKAEGKKSTVKVSDWGTQTLVYCPPDSYYDEDGIYHYSPHPKMNTSTREAVCSNGHEFNVKEKCY